MNIRKSIKAFGLLAGILVGMPALHAQNLPTLPTFTTANQITSVEMQYTAGGNQLSPAVFSSPTTGKLWAAFVSSGSTPYYFLSIAYSTDGVNFTTTYNSTVGGSAPAWAYYRGTIYLAYIGAGNSIYLYSLNESTGVITAAGSIGINSQIVTGERPSLASITVGINQFLYVAWSGDLDNYQTSELTGPWINVCVTQSPSLPLTWTCPDTSVSTSYGAGSGPALTTYNGEVYVTYLDAATGNPQMFATTSPGATTFVDLTGPGGGHGHYAGDPATPAFGGAMFPMFRSDFSEDNLWALGTYDGISFTPSYEYGQTLNFSPSTTVSNSGVLYQANFTNYPSSGGYMWIQSTASTTSGSGGGGKTSPGCKSGQQCSE